MTTSSLSPTAPNQWTTQRPRRRAMSRRTPQASSQVSSWDNAAPILLFLVGLMVMRLGAALLGDIPPGNDPAAYTEMTGD